MQIGGYLRCHFPAASPFGGSRYDEWVLLCGCQGKVGPALMLVAGDLCGDDAVEGRVGGSSGAVAHDRVVDVAGDDEQERA